MRQDLMAGRLSVTHRSLPHNTTPFDGAKRRNIRHSPLITTVLSHVQCMRERVADANLRAKWNVVSWFGPRLACDILGGLDESFGLFIIWFTADGDMTGGDVVTVYLRECANGKFCLCASFGDCFWGWDGIFCLLLDFSSDSLVPPSSRCDS